MSEHKINQWLYTFTVDREVEVEQSEAQLVNGETVKITKKVKEKHPLKFALKRPNRRLYEEADMFYGIKLSEGIRAGLLTRALLLKRYRNDGGALSDADATYFQELSTQYSQLEEKHQRLLVNLEKLPNETKQKEIDEIIKQKTTIVQALQSLEALNQALFAHTAESKAQTHLVNWWVVNLSYWDKEGKDEFVEFFPGEGYEEKMKQWDIFEEDREGYVLEAVARFSLLIGLWNAGAQSTEDFENGEKDYGTLTEKTEEKKETLKSEEKVAEKPTKKAAKKSTETPPTETKPDTTPAPSS